MGHDKYKAKAYVNGKWKNVKSSIFCMPVELENEEIVNDCNMHIENTLYPSSFGYLQIIYDTSVVPQPGFTTKRVSYIRERTDGNSLLRFENSDDEGYYLGFSFRSYSPFAGGFTTE